MQIGFLKFWRRRRKVRDQTAYLYSCVECSNGSRSRRSPTCRTGTSSRDGEEIMFECFSERDKRHEAIEAA